MCTFERKLDSRIFCVATTHLKARVGALLPTLRNEQGKDLLQFVKSHNPNDYPVIYTGDFNAEPLEPVYRSVSPLHPGQRSSRPTARLRTVDVATSPVQDQSTTTTSLLHFKPTCYRTSYRTMIQLGDLSSSYAMVVGQSSTSQMTSSLTSGGGEDAIESSLAEPPYTTWKIREDGEECHTIDYIFFSRGRFSPERVLNMPTGEELGRGRAPSLRYASDHFSLCCDLRLL